ncbi:hypothetical protein CA601_29520 [Paraburkholderia hospita]|nr:hypothetical protein CA601_29520 [Paraburkholderia hospita]
MARYTVIFPPVVGPVDVRYGRDDQIDEHEGGDAAKTRAAPPQYGGERHVLTEQVSEAQTITSRCPI